MAEAKAKAEKDAANVPAEKKGSPEIKPEITIEDFEKIDLRVGEVVACEKHPKADKLLVFQVRIGDEVRQIVSGVAKYYKPEEMPGKTCDCGGKSEVHQAERTGVQRDDSLRRQRGTPGNRNHRSAGRKSGEIDMKLTLFDSHAHLDVPEFDEDRDELLDRLTKECDISYVVNPGVDLETSSNAVKLAQKYPWIYAAVGLSAKTDKLDEDTFFFWRDLRKKTKSSLSGKSVSIITGKPFPMMCSNTGSAVRYS